MNYNERISHIGNFTTMSLIDDCRSHTPQIYKRHPYAHPELSHGVDLLRSEEALDCYISAYGEMHHAKCFASLQNLPYPGNEKENLSVELVDWGCGQGIASLCAIDYFKERDLTRWLKKVTLIEPGKAALDRAVANVSRATANRVRVVPISEYLPDVGSDRGIVGVSYEAKHIIHLFSNILDVPSIDLKKLACAVASSGHIHHILCMGPLNANAFRIDRFCDIFQPFEYFSSISDRAYGRTSDTNYTYTCKTKCFTYCGTPLSFSTYNPTETAASPVYSEYDVNLHIANGLMSVGKAWVYYRLQCCLSPNDIIYIDPDINGSSPDFVVIRPNVGAAIINVIEGDIVNYNKPTESGITKQKSDRDNGQELQSPYVSLENCRNLLIESIQELTEAIIEDNRTLSLVKTVLVCPTVSRDQALAWIGDRKYFSLYGSEFIRDENISRNFFGDIKLSYPSRHFDDIVLAKIKSLLSSRWHSYREGKEITLAGPQIALSKSAEGAKQKISGVAGSGKTLVLCSRAVNAQKRTGGNVLILTFNITLANYLRMRLGEIREDFPWDKIRIDYYHRFFRKYAQKHNKRISLGSYDEEVFFNDISERLPKFDAIFIDEVQDYMDSWLRILHKHFLRRNGEFVVFGDPKQNLYSRPLDNDGNIRIGTIPGRWNNSLTKGHRFSNPSLAKLALDFQNEFYDSVNRDKCIDTSTPTTDGFTFNIIDYRLVDCNAVDPYREAYKVAMQFIEDNNLNVGDVAIISTQTDVLRNIDTWYRQDKQNNATVAFIRGESIEKISKQSHQASYEYLRDYERLDRLMKNHFTMLSHDLKLSTIQSFKGWEAQTIICIIDKDKFNDDRLFNSPELIYTGITRAKENILIINLGNMRYHVFFNSHIN